ncbi:MAG: two-component regulator propeller domain-containing protein [Bacteroidota bacterium]
MNKLSKSLLLAGLLFAQWCWGQQPVQFTHYGTHEDISSGYILSIIQDREGFVWAGTLNGLNKFDGYKFKTYTHDPKQKGSLSGNTILTLFEDSRGDLYVGTEEAGLNVLDRNTDSFTHYTNQPGDLTSLGSNRITSMVEDRAGKLWVGTDKGGLAYFDRNTKRFTSFRHSDQNPNSLSSNEIQALAEDKQGNLWIGTKKNGLCVWDVQRKKFTFYHHQPKQAGSLSGDAINQIFVDREGRIWIATDNAGLERFDQASGSFVHYAALLNHPYPHKISNNTVKGIAQDKNGQLWVATYLGVNLLNPRTNQFNLYLENPSNPTSLISNSAISVFCDREDNIWIGTTSGLDRKDSGNSNFLHYRHNPNDSTSLGWTNVNLIYTDKRGNIWVGTGSGFDLFDRNTHRFKHFKDSQTQLGDIRAFYEDRKNRFWIANWTGLHLFDRDKGVIVQSLTHINPKDPASGEMGGIAYMEEDAQGNFWVMSWHKGVFLFKPEEKTFYPLQWKGKYIPTADLFSFHADPDGTLWIGTAVEGLFQINQAKGIYKNYTHQESNPQSISDNFVQCLYQDKKGNLWIGTRGGINLIDRKKGTFTAYLGGHLSNSVLEILEDAKGLLWISSVKGIYQFDSNKRAFKNYTVEDGLQHNQFTYHAASLLPTGEMLFGGPNGLNVFHPDSLRKNTAIPPVYITNFQLFNKSVSVGEAGSPLQKHITQTKEIVLSHEQTVFSLEFAALNYVNSKKNQYAYQLEGFDKNWNYVGTNRSATYTNLDPGTYTFRVKASNNDGVWNETGASIQITIIPPFWKTGWFRGASVLLMIAFVLAGYRYKTYQFTLRNRELEAKVAERTGKIEQQKQIIEQQRDNLQQLNQEISQQNEMLERKVEERTQELQASNEALRQTLDQSFDLNTQLSDRENFLSSILDQTPFSTAITDAHGTHLRVNQAYLDLFGLRDESQVVWVYNVLQDRTFREQGFIPLVETVFSKGIIARFEVWYNLNQASQSDTSARKQICLVVTIFPVKDVYGNVINAVIQHEDITERKKAEKNLLDSKRFYQILFQNSTDMVSTLDATATILYQSSPAQSLTGYTAAERQGHKLFDLVHPDDQSKVWQVFNEVVLARPGENIFHQYQLIHKDGRVRWLEIVANNLLHEPLVRAIVINSRDITERKLAADQLQEQNQELRKINAELDRFVYRTSHDLRAPLVSILGLINIIKDEPQEMAKGNYLAMMEKSILKLDTFIKNIIDYSRNARIEVKGQRIDFAALTEEVWDDLKYMQGSEQIRQQLTLTGNHAFYSDAFRMKIIFSNMLSNAIRYANLQAESYIHIKVNLENGCARIAFEDNGCGIAPEGIDHIFEMFYRASDRNVGSGLGLYIVKEAVQALKGSVTVASESDKGTVFHVHLPSLESVD